MKLISYYADPGEASTVSEVLRATGIVTDVSIVDPHIMRPSRSGASHVGLRVVLYDQFDDATKLLAGPDHVPGEQ